MASDGFTPRDGAHEGRDPTQNSIYTLSPLPPVLRHGLAAVSFFGFLSFVTTVALLFYLCFKILRWMLRTSHEAGGLTTGKVITVQEHDLPDEHLCPQPVGIAPRPHASLFQRIRDDPPNQFLVLILNLLLADSMQAVAFLLNASWLARDSIVAGGSLCWAQGWFVSTGDLSASIFITLIAVHTYLSVVRAYRMQTWAFYTMIIGGWFFNYFMAVIGIIITNNGEAVGGFYVRAGAWCWMNRSYQHLRFALHYLWLFVSIATTSVVYLVIFVYIKRTTRANTTLERPPHLKRGFSTELTMNRREAALDFAKKQTFLLYPIIYVCCTTPLAAGRVASMAGAEPSLGYFCFAAAMIASNGWLDVLLYATTRRSIVFSDNPAAQDVGLETFTFMRTPNRRFGNVVFVAGGADAGAREEGMDAEALRGRMRIGPLGKLGRLRGEAGQSEVSLRGGNELAAAEEGQSGTLGGAPLAIQMQTVTTVVVEVDEGGHTSVGSRRKGSMTSDAVSIASRV